MLASIPHSTPFFTISLQPPYFFSKYALRQLLPSSTTSGSPKNSTTLFKTGVMMAPAIVT